jgi:hypothetical protein
METAILTSGAQIPGCLLCPYRVNALPRSRKKRLKPWVPAKGAEIGFVFDALHRFYI